MSKRGGAQSSPPIITLILLAANLAAAAFTLGDLHQMYRWGFIPETQLSTPTLSERVLTIFTSLFVHVDPIHLLGNMVLLAGLGIAVEPAAGGLRFLAIYFIGGFAGALAHWAIVPASQAMYPLIGASGSLASLIGYYWLRFHRARVPIFPRVWVPIYALVVVWAILQAAGGLFAVPQFEAPVAYWAHLGGFLVGFALGLAFKAGSAAAEEAWQARMEEAHDRGASAQVAAAQEYLAKRPGDAAALKRLAEGLFALGNEPAGEEALFRLFEAEPGFEGGYAVCKLVDRQAASKIPVQKRFRAAQRLLREAPDAASRLLLTVLEERPGPETPKALLMLLELSASSDPLSARNYAGQLNTAYALSPEAETARGKWPHLF